MTVRPLLTHHGVSVGPNRALIRLLKELAPCITVSET